MTGAALLATFAGLRSGAGLVTLGMPSGLHALVAPAMLSAMSLPLPPEGGLLFAPEAVEPALEFAAGVTAIALGPGVTTEETVAQFVVEIAERARCPMVIDADGLNCLASGPAGWSADTGGSADLGGRVLTPHPGEAARLLLRSVREIQEDRLGAAGELARRHGAVAVLKGHGTIVTDGQVFYRNRTGNPGMATGGTGDVLTGLIGGLLAARMSPFDAAVLGVHLHGLAGDLAASRVSEPALTAGDLLDSLGPAFLAHGG
jgi:hydroxyethylthiazole kinase-like uncharacterized protein yjeF